MPNHTLQAVPRYSSDVGGLRPIADGSSISLMDSVDPRTGAKMMKSLTPVWQRKMNLVPVSPCRFLTLVVIGKIARLSLTFHCVFPKVDSLELASWEFNPFNACKVDAKQFGKDLWADHTTSGVPFALRMLQDQGCVDELCLDLRRLKRLDTPRWQRMTFVYASVGPRSHFCRRAVLI